MANQALQTQSTQNQPHHRPKTNRNILRSSKPSNRVLWLVDVFEGTKSATFEHARRAVEGLSAGTHRHLFVEPVYVLNPESLDYSPELSPTMVRYRPAAELALRNMFKKIDHMPKLHLLPGKVITQRKPTAQSAVRSVLAYAKSSGVNLIVAGTHGRKGLSRLILGSFCETLIQLAAIPVLIVGPESFPEKIGNSPHQQAIKKILFPSDLSAKSEKVFEQAIQLAKDMGAELILYHAITHSMDPVIQNGAYLLGGGWIGLPSSLNRIGDDIHKTGERWISAAKASGFAKVRLVLDTGGSAIESILKTAERESVDLVAMASQSGPIAAAIMGSIARQMVRSARCPVWICKR